MEVGAEVAGEDTLLSEKRAEIKRQLADGTYKTLGKVIADWTGRLIQKLARNPEPLPFWYGMTVTFAFFAVNQYALARIITNAKWTTLNGIQAQVEELQAREQILSEETLGHIDKLLDYHDRIRATRNSALNVRAGLNFLNSLLLPLIAFVLANLSQIIELLFN